MTDTSHVASERLAPVAPEFFVRDIDASLRFYRDSLGFAVLRQTPVFSVIALGDAHILLAAEALTNTTWLATGPRGVGLNVRIMVDDVDAMYERVLAVGAPVFHDIDDRDYGLRDFIVADPDGFLLRFAASVVS